MHHALRPRHQTDNTARLPQKGAQKGNGKAKTRDRLAFDVGPHRDQPISDRLLGRTSKAGAIVELAQIKDVRVHEMIVSASERAERVPMIFACVC
jgi:hypothetical protein